MSTLADRAERFAALHIKGNPLILYNMWDAGSARALEKVGAPAVATGSASVAAAQGYADGQAIPLDFLLRIVGRITDSVSVPVSVDFEGGYAEAADAVAANVEALLEAGAIGLNFEDQIVGGVGLYSVEQQVARIAAIRAVGRRAGVDLFINARTDLFLKERDVDKHAGLVAEAIARGQAYKHAGASGFFVPGLNRPDLVSQVCASVDLPVNVMMTGTAEGKADLVAAGVARISHGPYPYRIAMTALGARSVEV